SRRLSARAVVSRWLCGQVGPSDSTETRYDVPYRSVKYGAPESYRQPVTGSVRSSATPTSVSVTSWTLTVPVYAWSLGVLVAPGTGAEPVVYQPKPTIRATVPTAGGLEGIRSGRMPCTAVASLAMARSAPFGAWCTSTTSMFWPLPEATLAVPTVAMTW